MRLSFKGWLYTIDAILWDRMRLDHTELPWVDYYSMYDCGTPAEEAARVAIDNFVDFVCFLEGI